MKHKNLQGKREISSEELQESLREVERAEILLEKQLKEIASDESKNRMYPPVVVEAMKNSLVSLEKAKPAISKIISSIVEIRKEILNPVNKEIKASSKTSNILAIIGIVFGSFGILQQVYSEFIRPMDQSDPPPELIESNRKIGRHIDAHLNDVSFEEIISGYRKRVSLCHKEVSPFICTKETRQYLSEEFAPLDLKQLTDNENDDLSLAWIQLIIIENMHTDFKSKAIKRSEKNLDKIIRKYTTENNRTWVEAIWLKALILKKQGDRKGYNKLLSEIPNNQMNTSVFDFKNYTYSKLSLLLKDRRN